ncbi:MAG: beta-ketoacyl synthase N-terminal-like domain-containing protein [Candidatus Aminicenantes bacterium]|jgi:acyl transferase domain-containing protein/enoyl-CoA hydratase/carnithine racemase
MLTILNNYSHGYVTIPVIHACKMHGLFKTLNLSKPLPFTDVVKELKANSGHLRAALHMLESLKWISRNNNDEYVLTPEAAIHQEIPHDMMDLMSFPMNDYLNKNQGKHSLKRWFERSGQRWHIGHPMIANFLDGMLVIPLLLALKENQLLNRPGNQENQKAPLFSKLPPAVGEEITGFFINQGWLWQKNGTAVFTDTGRFIAERIFITAAVASYRPMLTNISEVIFGDCKPVFERDLSGSEGHVDRTLNVIASGFQHEKYFSDMEDIILSIFNRKPYGQQPKYIADTGCGDGTLLKRIYEIVKNKSLRGKILNEYPVKLIGIDFNNKALQETSVTLKDIDHLVLKGDIVDPEQVIRDLNKNGIRDTENILHVRSFLDHDRPYTPPADTSAANARSNIRHEGVYVDSEGNAIPATSVMQSLVEHLGNWSRIIGRHGLVVLEVHCLEPKVVSQFIDQSESLHFDAYHRFSQQLLVEAEPFLMAAAEVGLFARADFFKKYPKTLPFSRISLNHFEQREYQVRYAQKKDLPALEQLEKRCWTPGLRTPISAVKKRLKQYPQGQLVLELDNRVVGAVYSQRIARAENLKNSSIETVESLHDKEGPTVQLLGLNILPEMQQRNLGDQLLEFMLQRCSLMNGLHTVIGVTRCKDYHHRAGTTPQEYINQRNQQGRLVDTTLRFHQLHGAQIKGLIPNYRPRDRKNKGYGVLIEYDLYHRQGKAMQRNHRPWERMIKAKTAERFQSIKDFITKTILFVLGKTKDDGFSLQRPLMEMGLDSAHLLELSEQIRCQYQISLEPDFFFRYNTAEQVITYLQAQVGPGEEEEVTKVQEITGVTAKPSGQPDHSKKKEIAIVGAACRLPGDITNKDRLWELLTSGKDAITRMPPQRWRWPAAISPGNEHRGIDQGGFLNDIADFAASFFRISPKEAQLMDPQQRILLELSWECLEDAGYPAKALSGSKTGVFIGASGSDYNRLLENHLEEISAHFGSGISMAAMPNRISYFYDFFGPSIQIDTACSSSLLAVHEALKSIQAGECRQALVGGVNIMCHPADSIAYYKAGMLAKDGKCNTFDKAANGYVRGEGAVMILLKPLEQALSDGDSIYAVVKGSATNHGGQASGLTVPNPARQADLIIEAYETAGVEPETVGYIETHGTGTSLGDPVEISGLKEAFSRLARTKEEIPKPYCGLGSIKTNIGHLEAAAGIAGLLKVVLSLQQQTLPPSLNFKELNPHITLEKTPFYIVEKTQPWQLPQGRLLRRAGVSSFGSGGANAHVVLEEAPAVTRTYTKKKNSYLICLSAKTGEELRKKEQDLVCWLEKYGRQHNLVDISATLLLGREHFAVRAAFVVNNTRELQEKLKEVIRNKQPEGYFKESQLAKEKQVQPRLAGLDKTIGKELHPGKKINKEEHSNKLMALAELYIKGYDPDWEAIYTGHKILRISLPAYPFARRRFWVPEIKSKISDAGEIFSNNSHKPKGILLPSLSEDKTHFSGKPVEEVRQSITLSSPGTSLSPPPGSEGPQPMNHVQAAVSKQSLQEELTTSLAKALNMERGDIDVNEEFVNMGLDSIIGVEWMREINKQYGISMTATRVYDYPTIFEFAGFLEKELNQRGSQTTGNPVISDPVPSSSKVSLPSIQLPSIKPIEKRETITQPVVDFHEVEPGIVQLTMQDRVHKNTFSQELIHSLSQSFESIRTNSSYKVVILTGYDSYFASGGTLEGLLAIHEGTIKFTDINIYRLALDCKIPVIAAMQGHGIGAGWAMGMFCDFIVMSRESIYTSNYMKLGFTPGAGATLIFPEKFGIGLAQEILFTGKKYRGEELEAKGVPYPILPRKEVLPYAIQLAKTLAESPGESLMALKDRMTESIRKKLSGTIEKELRMHEKTLVNQHDVKERIQSWFGQSSKNHNHNKIDTSLKSQEKKTGIPREQSSPDPIAIIGMSGQFPGSKNLAEFWDNLAQGRDCISLIPAARWSIDQYYHPDPNVPGKTNCKWMGVLEDMDKFDPLFFNISPLEAELMDPQQRLFLENSWHCIEDAGLGPSSLAGSRCGVYVGCGTGDYFQASAGKRLNAHGFLGGDTSILSARISYLLNLKGPCLAINTACSSSLVALVEACNSLTLKTSDLALAGGVCVLAGPSLHIMTSKAGMLSPDGRCFTFDNRANGFVPGEGVGVILLKRLADAVRDRDHIYGVIRGWGVNQDGKTNGITAPSANSQILLEKDIYQRFGINPETISLVEAHGTGTKLGDPIEVEGLTESFRSYTQKKNYCALGSVKSNIGHLAYAAGAAGVIKLLLALQHRMLPPTIHFETLNEHISIDNSPFYINSKLQPWEVAPGVPRRCCVSSFGFSGTNAHIVIEEPHGMGDLLKYAPSMSSAAINLSSAPSQMNSSLPPRADKMILFILSAKSQEQLKIYADDMKRYIKSHEDLDLADMVYTLQVGREAMEYRLALVADSRESLLKTLEMFINNNPSQDILCAQVKKSKDGVVIFDADEDAKALLQTWMQKRKLKKIAELWVTGLNIDWEQLYVDIKPDQPRRISLPTYPFARERYWVSGMETNSAITNTAAVPARETQYEDRPAGRSMCFLKKQWEAVPFPTASNRRLNRTTAILTTRQTRDLATLLSHHFPKTHILEPHDLQAQFQQPEQEHQWKNYDGCVDLTGCGTEKNQSLDWLIWLQQLIEKGQGEGLMMLCVTRGLESYRNPAVNLSAAGGVGLYRMLQSEYSHLRSRHMDAAPGSDDKTLAQQIAAEFLSDNQETEICYREGKRYRAYLQEHQAGDGRDQPPVFPRDHVLWITGGTRGLGYLCARHFITHYGVKRLVLTGREKIPPPEQWDSYQQQNTSIAKKIRAIRSLESQGVQVRVLSVSLTDEHAVQQSLQEIKRAMGPVGGVIHCAGIVDKGNPAFIRKSVPGIRQVLDPKVRGLDIMVQNFKNEPLQFFILFSSVSAIIPTLAASQSDYAMANAYMDYAAEANIHNCPMVSIQWPSWKETGLGEAKTRAYEQTGLLSHTDVEGLQFLDHILAGDMGPVVLPAVVNPAKWKPQQLMQHTIQESPSTRFLPPRPQAASPAKNSDPLVKSTQTWLISLFSKELKLDSSKVEIETPFQEYGVDSILLTQLLRSITQQLALPDDLDPSILYEYSTIESLAAWLASTHPSSLSEALATSTSAPAGPAPQDSLSPPHRPSISSPGQEIPGELQRGSGNDKVTRPPGIAVIGLSCRFPGASTLGEYWDLLSKGRSAIGPVPRERWGNSNHFYAGLLRNITHFDPKFFLIPETDARAMDPQALLVLEESLNLFYHAGYSHHEIKGKPVGVFLGARSRHRPDESDLGETRNPIVAVGQNYLATNISQFFDLHGPGLVLDTACSSALVGMNMAIQALHSGEIDSALVGGVSLLNTDEIHRIFQQRGILSHGPSFHIFDQRASGVVLGEGVGLVLLKTLGQAIEDGDHIYAVINAIAINNDGRTAGPATPNLQTQKEVLQAALAKSGKKPEEISYIEANGSGSLVTDLLELKAIQSIYRSSNSIPCGLGSMKPNIGHPLCAEGIASFIKVVLMLQQRKLVPFLSGDQPMKHYNFESSPFYFCRKITEWNNTPPIAGINCFADGGTNAHAILEAWEEPASPQVKRNPIPPPKLDRQPIHQKNIKISANKKETQGLQINEPVLEPMVWDSFN